MSRYIDADALIEKEERSNLDHYIDGERCYQMVVPSWAIIEAPSIDIVRCKECAYSDVYGNEMFCQIRTDDVRADDFCSYGERREP